MINIERTKQAAIERVEEVSAEAIEMSHLIHENPELGFEEVKAHRWLTNYATAHGFTVETPVADLPTAFRASYRGGDGPTVAFLAEYDALPGVGHGCGHNLICTAASAAATAVKDAWPDLPGEIVIMGTPFEEGGGGKILMIERGAFNDVDLSMMFHPALATAANTPSLAAANLTITFEGKASHSAISPWQGVNAADAAMLFFNGVNAYRQHVTPDVRVHGVIKEAGLKPNIVPDHAVVEFMVRAHRSEQLEEVVEHVLNIARGAELMTRAKFSYERGLTYLDYRHSASLGRAAELNLEKIGVAPAAIGPDWPRASGDAGNVSQIVPHLSLAVAISDSPIPGHSPQWRDAAGSAKGEWALITAAKTMALTAIDIFSDPRLLETTKREQQTAMNV